jgi:anaerobic dimethyl sulfoxide reductase subunit A
MKIKAPDALLAAEVSRRGLMKTTAIGGLAMASSARYPLPDWRHAADTCPRQRNGLERLYRELR